MENNIKEKRQQFHRLLLALGEEKYKEVIVEGMFPGIESTTQLNEQQLDKLISDAKYRLGNLGQEVRRRALAPTLNPEEYQIKQLRNKCLQVLSERGIRSTPKDWTQINKELSAPRYQWVLTPEQREAGTVNKRGIGTFNTVECLKKLFYQLCAIRDNELKINAKVMERVIQN